jgi:hypothetical protein
MRQAICSSPKEMRARFAALFVRFVTGMTTNAPRFRLNVKFQS